MTGKWLKLLGLAILFTLVINAQDKKEDKKEEEEEEPVAVVSIGSAPGWSIKDGTFSAGPAVAFEFTPIKDWLKIEAGVTSAFGRHSGEFDTDCLFKKPWALSKRVEFMIGAGPDWIHSKQAGVTANAGAVEVVMDFLYWPTDKKRFGWYVEPVYAYSFAKDHDQSMGVSIGLLIGLHK